MEKKIAEIRKEFEAASFSEIPALIEAYWEDERSGVRNLIGKYEKKLDALDKERERLEAMRQYEHEYEGQYELICGIDEAGRGPLAGPVVAGAVILPKDCEILGLNDSKKLSEKKREELYDEIMEKAVAAAVGIVGPGRIDEINILQATYEAMREAVGKLSRAPRILLNDAVRIPGITIPPVPASILAKVTRDRLMYEYDKIMPEYGFASHKGYGSKVHIEALQKYGPSPIHRKTFITHFC